MKKNCKRLLSLFLALAVLAGLLIVPSAAAKDYSLTDGQIRQIEKDFDRHEWVLKRSFWANDSSTGRVAIKGVQKLFCALGYTVSIDGGFGTEMENTTKKFQKAQGLTADGIIGNGTFKALTAAVRAKQSANAKKNTVSQKNTAAKQKYNASAVLADAKKDLGKTGSQLGYNTAWCAYYVSDVLRDNGVKLTRAANPCDLVINALDAGLGTYYSFRTANTASLKKNGLKRTDLVVSTSRSKFTPKAGDVVIYLWEEDAGVYNWSHTGFVESFAKGSGTLKTLEGNTSGGIVARRTRDYDGTVVGILRLN